MSTLTPALERLLRSGSILGPNTGEVMSQKVISAAKLRSLVVDSLAKQMHTSAAFMCEQLIQHPDTTWHDLTLFARCYYQAGEYRRCLAFLEHKGMLSAEIIQSIINVLNPSSHATINSNGSIIMDDSSVYDAKSLLDRISAVQLAAQSLLVLEEYDDCLQLLNPLIAIDTDREGSGSNTGPSRVLGQGMFNIDGNGHGVGTVNGDSKENGNMNGSQTQIPGNHMKGTQGAAYTMEDRIVERAQSLFRMATSTNNRYMHSNNLYETGGHHDPNSLNCNINQSSSELNTIASIYATAGRCLDILDNRPRALRAFTMSLRIDAACVEVVDYIVNGGLLTTKERKQLLNIVAIDQFSESYSSKANRQWLAPYYHFMLGDSTPDTALKSMSMVTQVKPQSQESQDVGDRQAQPPPQAQMHIDANEMIPSPRSPSMSTQPVGDVLSSPGPDIAIRLGESPVWMVRRAEYALNRQFYEDAYRLARAAYTIDPFDMRGLNIYIASMVELRLKTELFYLGHELVHTYPKNAISWYAVGCYYWVCHKYEASQKYLQKATKLNRRMHNAWIALGHVLAVQEESEHAISVYRAACRLVPGDHRPLCYMGKELVRTNNLSLGLHILLLSLSICPSDPTVRNELGVAYMRQNNLTEAETHLRLAAMALYYHTTIMIVDGVASAAPITGSSSTGWRSKTPDRGVGDMRRDNELDSVQSSGSSQETTRQSSSGAIQYNVDEAGWGVSGTTASVGTRAGAGAGAGIAGSRGSDEVLSNYATCLRRLDRYTEALTWYERCLAYEPNCASTHAHIGFTLHLSGRFEEAIDSYHRSLTLQPNHAFCSDMLSRALTDMSAYDVNDVTSMRNE